MKKRRAWNEKPTKRARRARWLLLIHQIPPKPAYFRAKVGRRLLRMGAVAIKNSVYALPLNQQTLEDLRWLAGEIVQEGGEATLCSADFIDGLADRQVEALFRAARKADYAKIAEEARDLVGGLPATLVAGDERRVELEASRVRLTKWIAEIVAIDFFGAPGRHAAEAAIGGVAKKLHSAGNGAPASPGKPRRHTYRERTWVTRKNVHVDRIASAWLIRRFIDHKAKFKFVSGRRYRAEPGEVTFDMFEADFTHVGNRCTFEVLADEFDIRTPGVSPIAQIVHDVDMKDDKFGRAEAPGFASLVAGIVFAHRGDGERLEAGARMLDAMLEVFRRQRPRQ